MCLFGRHMSATVVEDNGNGDVILDVDCDPFFTEMKVVFHI